MSTRQIMCPCCNAPVDASKRKRTCEYCGSTIIIDDGINHVHVENAVDIGYQFEKGRQRAQEELQHKAKMRKWIAILFFIAFLVVFITSVFFILYGEDRLCKSEERKEIVEESVIINSSEILVEVAESQTSLFNKESDEVETVDYLDENEFELELNQGKKLEGLTVTFKVKDVKPDAVFGYNLWAGENLNFYFTENIGASIGDSVTVRADNITTILGTWQIRCELISLVEGDGSLPATPKQNLKEMVITDFGYSVFDGYLHVGFMLNNPNEEFYIQYPTVRITARGQSGVLLGTADMVLSEIYPNDTISYGGLAFAVKETPATVEITPIEPEEYNVKHSSLVQEYIPMNVLNYSVSGEDFCNVLLGEINNPNVYDVQQAVVIMMYRDIDDRILFAETTYVNKVPAGETVPFSGYFCNDAQYEKCTVTVMPW